MSLTAQYKGNRPFGGLQELAEHGIPGLFNPNVSGLGLAGLLEPLMAATGINVIIQVNDCETQADWTESDNGTFDQTVGTAGKRVGTNDLKLTSTQSTDNTQFVDTLFIDESAKVSQPTTSSPRQMDWRNTRYIGWWHHAVDTGEYGTDGEMKFAIVNNGTIQSKVSLTGNAAQTHQWQEIDMVAEGWDRDKVESIRFYSDNTNTAEDYYADDIIRYQISYNKGPLYGCMFPIKSGTALSEGDIARWTIDGLVKSSSADIADLGPVKLFKDGLPVASATGTATRNIMGMIPGVFIFIGRSNGGVTAGDLVETQADRVFVDVTTTTTSKGMAQALETDGEANDDLMLTLVKPGNSG